MKVFEVNFEKLTDYPPFDYANSSVYVKANTREEAIEIAIQYGVERKKVNDCWEIKTIN